jgi:hypothetical protein
MGVGVARMVKFTCCYGAAGIILGICLGLSQDNSISAPT